MAKVDFNESQTKKNLETAFVGESQAHTKYEYYAKQAVKDGYVQIGDIFEETSGNEAIHAKVWFKYLHGGHVPDTLTNLKDAADQVELGRDLGEALLAGDLGELGVHLGPLVVLAGGVEKAHEERYNMLIERIENGEVFEREGVKVWQCLKCGYLHVGPSAPQVCPICGHPQAYFQQQETNY